MLVNTPEEADRIINRLRQHEGTLGIDVETSGLNPRKNHIVAYVLSFSHNEHYYVPVRHAGGGNLPGGPDAPQEADSWDGRPHPFDMELARIARNKSWNVVGHNLQFDLQFCARHGIFFPNSIYSCTQVAAAIADENAPGFSLEASCRRWGVIEKLGDGLYAEIYRRFKDDGCPEGRKSMGYYWRMPGDDALVVDYATGDGISTWQLYHRLMQEMAKVGDRSRGDEPLERIWQLEQRVTRTLFHLMHRGIKIDVDQLNRIKEKLEADAAAIRQTLPEDFNERSGPKMLKLFTDAGFKADDFPKTPTGRPSFTEDWLETNDLGRRIIELRQCTNLINSFVEPMLTVHLHNGRVHPNYNQLRGDDYGTISGRLSSNDPNIQQVPKRNKKLSKIFRSIFVPDEGMEWLSKDAKQCLAEDTQVMIPGGIKLIKDIREGDLVYSYTDDKKPTIKKVLWSGMTGQRKLYRLHWMTNGRTKGYLDATDDHLIRLHDGSYKSVGELLNTPRSKRSKHKYNISTWAMRRAIQTTRGQQRHFIFTDGHTRYKESRLIVTTILGRNVEEVHHKDDDTLNDSINNLQELSKLDHLAEHGNYRPDITTDQVHELYNNNSQRAVAAILGCSQRLVGRRLHEGNPGNHTIIDIEELPGLYPVYDITVEDTHNFIANEICVHNCEPRIFAEYSQSKMLIDGYLQKPTIDLYNMMSKITGADRETCKRLALGIFYGAGIGKTATLIGCSEQQAKEYRSRLYQMVPEIPVFSDTARDLMAERGWVKTKWGRKLRIADSRFYYKASNRIVQGCNADYIKLAICDVQDYYDSCGAGNVLLTCHDSIESQIAIGRKEVQDEAIRIMEEAGNKMGFKIPQEVEFGSGRSWSEATFGAEA